MSSTSRYTQLEDDGGSTNNPVSTRDRQKRPSKPEKKPRKPRTKKKGKSKPTSTTTSSSSSSYASTYSTWTSGEGSYMKMRKSVHSLWPETRKSPRDLAHDSELWGMLGRVDPALDVPRIDYHAVGRREFAERYDWAQRPVIIRNAMTEWKAMKRWDVTRLQESSLGRKKFHLRSNRDGSHDKVRLKDMARYAADNSHDDPLYLFDERFQRDRKTKKMLSDYEVPKYFTLDLNELLRDDHRSPYRWILLGGQRSGSAIHVDPLGTSAWNALISGHKRWYLAPPHYTKEQVGGVGYSNKNPPGYWWKDVYPKVKNLPGAMECIQGPGEIIFVPGGWWHVVINLDVTFCVTQNFVTPANFEEAWRVTARKRPRRARRWRKLIQRDFPEIAQRIHGFEYYYGSDSETTSTESSGWTSADNLETTDTTA